MSNILDPDEEEFIITTHAKERMAERLGTKPHKFVKLAKKAWKSNDTIRQMTTRMKYQQQFREESKNIALREYMGFIFVFALFRKNSKLLQKKLITVYG